MINAVAKEKTVIKSEWTDLIILHILKINENSIYWALTMCQALISYKSLQQSTGKFYYYLYFTEETTED